MKNLIIPEFVSSIGSNSPSAHESVFHTALELGLFGLVIIWFDDKHGKSTIWLFWSIALDLSLINSVEPNLELLTLATANFFDSFSSFS